MSNLGPVAASDPEAELRLIEVDVSAVVDLCSRFVPGMVDRGRGAVLNVASVGAFGPVPGQATYGAAKAFVLSYTDAMRQELHGTGVTAPRCARARCARASVRAMGIPDEEAEKSLPKFLWKEADAVAKAAHRRLGCGKARDRSRRTQPRGVGDQPSPAAAAVAADGCPQPPGAEEGLARRPDEVDDVAGDDVGLIELQEVPGIFDDRDLTAVGQHLLDPVRVIRCGTAVVGAVQIQRRHPRRRQPVLVQFGVLAPAASRCARRSR